MRESMSTETVDHLNIEARGGRGNSEESRKRIGDQELVVGTSFRY
jgi:hypothetical protein